MVETESTEEAERDRVLRGGAESATGLLERCSCSLLALASASIPSATPALIHGQTSHEGRESRDLPLEKLFRFLVGDLRCQLGVVQLLTAGWSRGVRSVLQTPFAFIAVVP